MCSFTHPPTFTEPFLCARNRMHKVVHSRLSGFCWDHNKGRKKGKGERSKVGRTASTQVLSLRGSVLALRGPVSKYRMSLYFIPAKIPLRSTSSFWKASSTTAALWDCLLPLTLPSARSLPSPQTYALLVTSCLISSRPEQCLLNRAQHYFS